MSFASEVIADFSGKFCGNSCRYATREEAEAARRELMSRWMAVRETRVVELTDPVNYRFADGKTQAIQQGILISGRSAWRRCALPCTFCMRA